MVSYRPPCGMRVRDSYVSICTVYAVTRDLAGEVNTGSMIYSNINMFSHSQINGASRDRGATKNLMMSLPKYRSSADLLWFLRKGMGLIRTYCCFYRSIKEI